MSYILIQYSPNGFHDYTYLIGAYESCEKAVEKIHDILDEDFNYDEEWSCNDVTNELELDIGNTHMRWENNTFAIYKVELNQGLSRDDLNNPLKVYEIAPIAE